ncbi:MAG: response regulator [bacterium]|jgi:DNA-binding response OmpR family regulator/signal recognition particle receptor subunit beta|nr:response regulator [candidate division KSB1 bacterium]MDH7560698.1 response regulator [bacterium]
MPPTSEDRTKLLLVDPHAENVRILREHLSALGYQVYTCSGIGEAVTKIPEVQPDLVLSEFVFPDADGAELLDRIESDPRTARTPVMFLSKAGDAETKIRALNLGAKDFLAKPMHVREVVARVQMVLARLRRRRSTAAQRGPSGRLEEVPLFDLLLQMSQEGTTATVRLTTPSGLTGQVVLRRGAVVNAMTNKAKQENALFDMLMWRRGRFSVSYEETDATDGMPLSTLGLLLEGARRLEEIQSLEKQLPGLDAVMVATENFRQILARREPSPEMQKFISLFDGQRTLNAVIDDCGYDLPTALQRIVKLYRQGFLRRVGQPEPEAEEVAEAFGPVALREPKLAISPEEEESEAEPETTLPPTATEPVAREPQEQVAAPPVEKPASPRPTAACQGIIFIGSVRAGRRQIVRTLTEGNFRVRTLRSFGDVSLDRGSALLSNGTRLEVFGLEPDPRFGALSKIVAFELSGCVIVVDGSQAEHYDYYAYLISALRRTLAPLPSVVAVTNLGAAPPNAEAVRRRLGLTPADPLCFCDPADRESVETLVAPLLELGKTRKVGAKVTADEQIGSN